MMEIEYVNNNDNIMKDRIADKSSGDVAVAASDRNNEGTSSVTPKKRSLLRSQLLRRTTTRTKKRLPGEAARTPTKENAKPSTTIDVPGNIGVGSSDTIPQSVGDKHAPDDEFNATATSKRADDSNPKTLQMDGASSGGGANDSIEKDTSEADSFQLHQVHHNEEFELKNGSKRNKVDLSLPRLEEEEEEETKSEAVASDPPTRADMPRQSTAPAATVATRNLSIVVTGNDIVVEYRGDNRGEPRESSGKKPGGDVAKEPAAAAAASNSILSTLFAPLTRIGASNSNAATASSSLVVQQQPARSRPKGIMKRPRHSNTTYHHPRRPLPPPLPPPGYRDNVNSSPMSWTTTTSGESSDSERQGQSMNAPPLAVKRKRVTFNEQELTEQLKSFELRRQSRTEFRHSFLGMLGMAVPVIMPYFMAVFILVATSMVPLPTKTRHQQQSSLSSLQPGLVNVPNVDVKTAMPSSPPIFFDVASRLWDERANSKEVPGSASALNSDSVSVQVASKGLQVVGAMEASNGNNNAIAVVDHRFNQRQNPVVKTVAKVFQVIRRDKGKNHGVASNDSE